MRTAAIALFLLMLASSLAGCAGESKIYDVRYEVISNCDTVDVTYDNGYGGTSQKTADTGEKDQNDDWIPWTYSFSTEFTGFTFMYISGQSNCDGDSAAVIVSIYIDDKIAVFGDCDGGYCIATASDMR
jgi:hypothetical protein